jgi:5'-nucleotidase/UDP-sugar diphosphatase
MKKIASVISFILLFSTFLFAQPDTLTILHVNDSHSTLEAIGPRDANLKGTLGGISRIATLVGMTKMTEPNVLFLHAGDISIGDLFFNKYFQVPELQILSSLGLDAITLGNHEFDLTPEALLGSLQYVFPDPNNAFPLLSANTDFTAIPDMQSYVKEYVIKNFGNAKVGIFGLTTPETALISNPSPAVIETDIPTIATIAATMVQKLKTEGCNVIILLSHLGFEFDKFIAANIPGINIIVGGHDHYKFEQPDAETDPMGETTWIVQAGSNYMYAGKTTLKVDDNNVELINYQLIPIDTNIPQNEEVQAAVDGMIADIESYYQIPFYTQQVGYTNTFFAEEATNLFDLGAHDTPAGNLVADAFRVHTETDIALQAGGSIALPLWAGAFTPGDLFRVNGYGFNTVNTLGFQLVTFDLTGLDIWKGLEFGLSQIEVNDEYFLQVSGMEYVYDATKPVGERVVSVTINGNPIDPGKTYSITANEMVLGILNYVGINPASVPQVEEGYTEFQALMDYTMSQNNFLVAKEIGRVLNVGNQMDFNGIMGAGWMDIDLINTDKKHASENKLFFEIHLVDFGSKVLPKGKVNIRIPQINVNLKSDFCDWLIIENSTATIRGSGKINNRGNYGFMLIANDGQANKKSTDELRVVIWDKNDNDKIIFDNLVPKVTHGLIVMSTNPNFEKDMGEPEESVQPTTFALEQNYPNPFNPSTTISYSISEAGNVDLKVYDILGNEVITLVNETKSPGNYAVVFDATSLASGIYIYVLKSHNFVQTRKMLLLK